MIEKNNTDKEKMHIPKEHLIYLEPKDEEQNEDIPDDVDPVKENAPKFKSKYDF